MAYPTDLNDEPWAFIEPIFKRMVGNYCNRAKWSKRELVNAVLYLNKTGCQWQMLPNDFPPYTTVSSFYHRARANVVWTLITQALAEADRLANHRLPKPSYAHIDSQSVKTTGASEERGIGGGKKVKGRKRHIVSDILGNLLCVHAHAANIHDTIAGCAALDRALVCIAQLKAFAPTQVIAERSGNMQKVWV